MKITDEQILSELKAGLSRRRIAEKYNVHITTIYQRVDRMKKKGIEVPSSPFRVSSSANRNRKRHIKSNHRVKRCGKSDCKYSTCLGGDLICDYLSMMGHSRGCPPESCNKYEKA